MASLRIVIVTLVCLLQPVAAFEPQSEGAPVGMVLAVDGGVEVERNGERTPVQLGDLLFGGDRLTTGSGLATLIYCPSEQTIILAGGTVATLGRDAITFVEGNPRAVTEAGGCFLPQVALGAESLERVGGMRVRGYPPIPLYLGGRVSEVRPVFSWAASEGAETYDLTLSDITGQILWEFETTALSAAYPSTLTELAEGSYLWELRGQAGTRTTGFQNALFQVEPSATLSSKAATDDAARLLRAMELESSGYYAESAGELRGLLSGEAPDKRILGRLAWLYWTAGLIAAADETMKRLDALQ